MSLSSDSEANQPAADNAAKAAEGILKDVGKTAGPRPPVVGKTDARTRLSKARWRRTIWHLAPSIPEEDIKILLAKDGRSSSSAA